MESAHKAQKFLEAKDYAAAITHFTNALKTSNSPVWLIQRSTAYQRNNEHDLAVLDAENAVLAARERGKRELIATAQFRRAIALHSQGRYGDARLCFIWCNKYNEKEKGLTMWVAKNKKDYDKAGGDEAECNKTTVKEIPEPHIDVKQIEAKTEGKGKGIAASTANTVKPKQADDKKGEAEAKTESKVKSIPATTPAPVAPTPKEKVRMEWYQSSATVSISIFAKGIPKEEAEVVIEEGAVSPKALSRRNMLKFYSLRSLFLLVAPVHTILQPPRSSQKLTSQNQTSASLHTS
jgi:suppressor of G2 allele of SKP1